ncbi:hypothetical protein HZH66_005982 [Vespula vulgaris]|uniref:Uncharacterized protein n=1 Tax=Vespula vulgaris TaxID=7454 RepID=A0A834K656_VESVU|nr:hypothetical protein HZH66_005982 [Vespula vulgaris]
MWYVHEGETLQALSTTVTKTTTMTTMHGGTSTRNIARSGLTARSTDSTSVARSTDWDRDGYWENGNKEHASISALREWNGKALLYVHKRGGGKEEWKRSENAHDRLGLPSNGRVIRVKVVPIIKLVGQWNPYCPFIGVTVIFSSYR